MAQKKSTVVSHRARKLYKAILKQLIGILRNKKRGQWRVVMELLKDDMKTQLPKMKGIEKAYVQELLKAFNQIIHMVDKKGKAETVKLLKGLHKDA